MVADIYTVSVARLPLERLCIPALCIRAVLKIIYEMMDARCHSTDGETEVQGPQGVWSRSQMGLEPRPLTAGSGL